MAARIDRTRVRAELRLAQQRGEIASGEQYPQLVTEPAVSKLTREQVKAELRLARERGQLRDGEQYPFIG